MADVRVSIDMPEGPFYQEDTIDLKVRLDRNIATQKPIYLQSEAFEETDGHQVLLNTTTPKTVTITLSGSAEVGKRLPITVKSADGSITVETDRSYAITLDYPTVRFEKEPDVSNGYLHATAVLNRKPAVMARAAIHGECLQPRGETWSARDNCHLVHFDQGERRKWLTLRLKESGFTDSSVTISAKLNCVTADADTRYDLNLTPLSPPKVRFAATAIRGKRLDENDQDGLFQIGPALLYCELDDKAPPEGAKAEVISEFFDGGPFVVTFEAGQLTADPVEVTLKDTGGRREAFTLKAAGGCELPDDNAKTTLNVSVQAPKVRFADTPVRADTVPGQSGVFRVGEGKIACTVTYRLPGNTAPGKLSGDCFEETEKALSFRDNTTAEATVTLKDTNGKAETVRLTAGGGYLPDDAGKNTLELTVEAPKVRFAEKAVDAEPVPGKPGVYQPGSALFSCELTYPPTGGGPPASLSGECILEKSPALILKGDTEAEARATLTDTDGKSVTVRLEPGDGYRLDDKGKTTETTTVEAPAVQFAEGQPDAERLSGDTGPYKSGTATFTGKLSYAPAKGARAKIVGEFLEGREREVNFPDAKAVSDPVRVRLKDTGGKAEPFTIEPVKGCKSSETGTVLKLEVKDPFSEDPTREPVQKCGDPGPVPVTIQVCVRHSDRAPEFLGNIKVQLKGPSTREQTTAEGNGLTVFEAVGPGAYTASALLTEKQKNQYREPDPLKITVTNQERDPYVIYLEEILWIRIKLVDHFGNPVPDETYIIEFPDGSNTGVKQLDQNGEALHASPQPGDCIVRFPNWYAHDFVPEEKMGTFIHIELRDCGGVPIPGEPYRITFPDGSTAEGRLDGRGQAIHPSAPGECTVQFPNWYADDLLPKSDPNRNRTKSELK